MVPELESRASYIIYQMEQRNTLLLSRSIGIWQVELGERHLALHHPARVGHNVPMKNKLDFLSPQTCSLMT
jgi:hypothetical protein